MEDNKQMQEQEQEQKIEGWKDIILTPDTPLSLIIHTMNMINQRLCQIEDIMQVNYQGKTMSITEKFALQAQEIAKKQQEQAKAQEQENKAE